MTKRWSGFSLIELMLALVLGLLLLGGAIGVFLANQASGRTNSALGELQNIARITTTLMSYDIRNAGFNGCSNTRMSNVIAVAGAQPAWADWPFGGGIEGLRAPVGTIGGVNATAGTEALRLMYGAGESWLIEDYDGSTLTLNEAPSLSSGDIVIACDEKLASIFQATSVVGDEVTHFQSGLNCDDNLGFVPSAAWSCGTADPRTFSNSGMLMAFQSVVWFVAQSTDNPNVDSLYRASLIGDALVSEEIVYGVSGMTLTYLDADTMNFMTAAQIEATSFWEDVIAVRVVIDVDDDAIENIEIPDEAQSFTFITNLRNRT